VNSQNEELVRRAHVVDRGGLKVVMLDGLLNLGSLGLLACRQLKADVAILTRNDYPAGLIRFSCWTPRSDLDLPSLLRQWYGYMPGFQVGGQAGNAGGSFQTFFAIDF
jgi:hypothetical protein